VTAQVSPAPAFTSPAQALATVLDGMRYLAAADHAAMAAQAQADCLLGLEQAAAMSTAARAGLLGCFALAAGTARTGITASPGG
jgi:hypothetical protein